MKRATVVFAGILLMADPAWAQLEYDFGAFVENDLRVNVARVDEPAIGRNETALGFDLVADLVPDKLRFVGDVQFVWIGFTRDTNFDGMTSRSTISPYHLESKAVFIEVVSLLPHLDLRVGRQIVHWGTADLFNPTANLNALDLEDPLKFGESIANEMIVLDWAPGGDFILSAVWVPVFQPNLLPRSGQQKIGDPRGEFPFANPQIRLEAEKLRSVWLNRPEYWIVDTPALNFQMPKWSFKNSQFGLRVQWMIGLFDMSLSYYRGYDTMPVAKSSVSGTYSTDNTAADGTPVRGVTSDVTLVYPKKQVIGFDLAGQLPFLDDAGVWFEGAFVFPRAVSMSFDLRQVVPGAKVVHGEAVRDEAYFQYTAGMDYNINEHLYLTGQFIRGFVDEFGAHNLNHYWVGGLDVRLLQEQLIIRLFCLGEIPHEDDDVVLDEDQDGYVDSLAMGATDDGTIASYVLFPAVMYKPADGLTLSLGGYVLLGHQESKFGQDAAGPSLVFFKARASF